MKDSRTAKELATIVENMWCNGSVHEPTARAVKEALDRLDAYERPPEDAEVQQIDKRPAMAKEADALAEKVFQPCMATEQEVFRLASIALSGVLDQPVLLFALRRERAEKEALVKLVLAYRSQEAVARIWPTVHDREAFAARIRELERQHGHLAKEMIKGS